MSDLILRNEISSHAAIIARSHQLRAEAVGDMTARAVRAVARAFSRLLLRRGALVAR